MIDITLAKAKYRRINRALLKRADIDPPGGTWVYNAGSWKAKSSNSGKGVKKSNAGKGQRRKAYGPFYKA